MKCHLTCNPLRLARLWDGEKQRQRKQVDCVMDGRPYIEINGRIVGEYLYIIRDKWDDFINTYINNDIIGVLFDKVD